MRKKKKIICKVGQYNRYGEFTHFQEVDTSRYEDFCFGCYLKCNLLKGIIQ